MRDDRNKVSKSINISLEECQVKFTNLIIDESPMCWVITDGKAGDIRQCEGLAKAMNLKILYKTITINRFFSYFYFLFLQFDIPHFAKKNIFSPPFPDIIIASGRRAVPFMRIMKRKSPKTFCIFLKNPRCNNSGADIIWQPEHDTDVQPNAIRSLLSPHHIVASSSSIQTEHPIIGVLVGGNSKHTRWKPQDIKEFLALLKFYSQMPNVKLNITTSRRTPFELREALKTEFSQTHHQYYGPESERENPYQDILTTSSALIVTSDSINMLSEALTSGCPVYIFEPTTKNGRIRRHISALVEQELVTSATSSIQFDRRLAYNVTPALAHYASKAYLEFRDRN